jgi:hypothetical protein
MNRKNAPTEQFIGCVKQQTFCGRIRGFDAAIFRERQNGITDRRTDGHSS